MKEAETYKVILLSDLIQWFVYWCALNEMRMNYNDYWLQSKNIKVRLVAASLSELNIFTAIIIFNSLLVKYNN